MGGTINDGVSPLACGCVIPGSGASLVKVGAGTLTLSGANTYTGGTTITAGTLQLGNGGTTGSILGDVVNNATLAFNRSNAYQFDGAISGSGAVQQIGAGTTTLTAVNTYAGATTISAGIAGAVRRGQHRQFERRDRQRRLRHLRHHRGSLDQEPVRLRHRHARRQTLTLTNASGTFAGAIGGNRAA